MKKRFTFAVFALILCLLTACVNGQGVQSATPSAAANAAGEVTDAKLRVFIGEAEFTATLEQSAAAEAFTAMMEKEPVVIQMRDYGGFEKVGSLGASLPASDRQTTTEAGDIVLYNGNQIVIFYGSNSWSYTRLGKIDDLTGWAEALGSGDVVATFS
ncbi:MAG: cyclophilin-like fold protein, partial [Clostridia bacterium]|nr:cyclophilin-like fold protein [Clostridia bacterium]